MARKNQSHKINIMVSLPAHVVKILDTHLEHLKADGIRKSRSEYLCDLMADRVGIDKATYVYNAAVKEKPRSAVPLDIDPLVENKFYGMIPTSKDIELVYKAYLDYVYKQKMSKDEFAVMLDCPKNGVINRWFAAFGTMPPLDKWQQEFMELNPGVDLTGALEDAKLKVKKVGE